MSVTVRRAPPGPSARSIALLAAAVAFAVTAGIALAVRQGLLLSLDYALSYAMAPTRGVLPLALALTWLGDSGRRFAILAIAVVAMLMLRRRRGALWLAAVVTGGTLANSGVKAVVARPRPALLPHLDTVTSYSFPSGHAAGATILWLALALIAPPELRRPAVVLAILMAVATGVSRVMLAVHWPSDVLAGWAFGVGWVLLWCPLAGRRG